MHCLLLQSSYHFASNRENRFKPPFGIELFGLKLWRRYFLVFSFLHKKSPYLSSLSWFKLAFGSGTLGRRRLQFAKMMIIFMRKRKMVSGRELPGLSSWIKCLCEKELWRIKSFCLVSVILLSLGNNNADFLFLETKQRS